MARRRRYTRAATSEPKEVDRGKWCLDKALQHIKMLAVHSKSVRMTRIREPLTYLIGVPILLIYSGLVWAITVPAFIAALFGPVGVYSIRKESRDQIKVHTDGLLDVLSNPEFKTPLVLFALKSASRNGLKTGDHLVPLSSEFLGTINRNGKIEGWTSWKYIGVAELDDTGRIKRDLSNVQIGYWLAYCERNNCSEAQILDHLAELPIRSTLGGPAT